MEKSSEIIEPVAGPSRPDTSRASIRGSRNSPILLKRNIINSTRIARKTTRTRPSYAKYIRKVCRDTQPDLSIGAKSVEILDDMMHDVFERLAKQAGVLIERSRKKTMSMKDLEAAAKLLIPGLLGEFALNEGRRVMRIWYQ